MKLLLQTYDEKSTCHGHERLPRGFVNTMLEITSKNCSITACYTIFEVFWTCVETVTGNGEWCDAWGDEWEDKARKTEIKLAEHTKNSKRTIIKNNNLSFQTWRYKIHSVHSKKKELTINTMRATNMEKCYRGCRTRLGDTRGHIIISKVKLAKYDQ